MGDMRQGDETEQRVTHAAQVREFIWREAKRREGLDERQHPHSPNALRPDSPATKRLHLRHLEVAAEHARLAQELMEEIAVRAGRSGASYPEMGVAAGVTRQAARNRWPQAVGRRWHLYTMTGREHPHGAGTAFFRGRDKAVQTGWDAVRKGESASGGEVAATVTDSERRVVWSCVFDPVAYDAVPIELPENLTTVPTGGGQDYQMWFHRWTQFVDAELRRRTTRS
jgi:hypothetical protein